MKVVGSLGILVFAAGVAGCDSDGTVAAPPAADAAGDTTTGPEASAGDDAGASPGDANADAGQPVCTAYLSDAGTAASSDCIIVGRCPEDCLSGTATAYACAPANGGAATYPSTFQPPGDPFTVVAYASDVYPWEGGAFVTCAPETCVRWSFADHADGGSSWPSDPCAAGAAAGGGDDGGDGDSGDGGDGGGDGDGGDDGGAATAAWVCPSYQGFAPPVAGCINAGSAQQIGGGSTGADVNIVWCCPPQPMDGGPDGAAETGAGEGGDVDGGAGEAGPEAGAGEAGAGDGAADDGADASGE